jgi:hypothetical protein
VADREGDWTPLHGGNVNTVSRQGDIVRRELSAASGAVHQLLKHLEKRNAPLVPRLLDSDARYEFLSYLPGRALFRPWPDAVRGRGAAWLTDLGTWLRAYHDAVRGFRVQNALFLWGPDEPGEGMLVCHGDLGPWNCLHRQGRLTGVIDWDLARYGDPLDDVAELALEAVPLHARLSETLGEAGRELLESRLELFCQAYGVPAETVLDHLPTYLKMVIEDVRKLATEGAEPFVSFARGEIPAGLEADLRYCRVVWA